MGGREREQERGLLSLLLCHSSPFSSFSFTLSCSSVGSSPTPTSRPSPFSCQPSISANSIPHSTVRAWYACARRHYNTTYVYTCTCHSTHNTCRSAVLWSLIWSASNQLLTPYTTIITTNASSGWTIPRRVSTYHFVRGFIHQDQAPG